MTEALLVCANHPDRETSLRCNKCGKLICSQCAVRTPVGYRCKECVRGQQKIFETAVGLDYAVALVLAAIGVALAVGVLNFIGFWGLLVAPIAGGGLAEIIRWAVRKRRSRRLPLAAAIGGVLGVLPHLGLPVLSLVMALGSGVGSGVLLGGLFATLWPLASGAIMVSTIYYRLRGIRF
jgi:hypothetical protein